MAPFYGWVSTASRPEPFRGGSLLFNTKFPELWYNTSRSEAAIRNYGKILKN